MKRPGLALQLFTVRDAVATDLDGTLRRVAGIGYAGVEPFGLTPDTARRTRRLCDELGLAIPSVHVPMPTGDRKDEVLEVLSNLKPERVVSGLGRVEFQTWDLVARACEQMNEADATLTAAGYSFGVHNHWWEFQELEGAYPYHYLLEHLYEDIFFELDVYWMQAGGVDPATTILEYGDRAHLLHVKDGPAIVGEPMVALGEGSVDIPGIVKDNEAHNEWLIVELDNCATDVFDAITSSLRYLEASVLGGESASAPRK